MGILLKTHKLLWGKSGNRCAFPNCRLELVIDETETDDPSIIGEEAHIVAQKDDGPRGKSELDGEQRDKYENLILLCSVHHKLVDDQENKYTVSILHEYKRKHEAWVKENLTIDLAKQRDDLLYSSYIDRLIELAEIENWKGWTSFVFGSGEPSMYQSNLDTLHELIRYILARVWPGRYPDLEKAFYNFKNVSNDFLNVFEKYSNKPSRTETLEEDDNDPIIRTRKFYRIDEWDTQLYNSLLREYEYHCWLVEDLALEMTRAANFLFDQVRRFIFPNFRLEEGVLLVEIGPFMDLSYKTVRAEYSIEERASLYPGLRAFMEIRTNRSNCRGEGVSEKYFPTLG